MKRVLTVAAVVILVVAGLFLIVGNADATEGDGDKCYTTEVVHHPEVPAVTEVIPGTADVWANFSPNHQQGPFEGPPSYPNDERGTWHVHDKIPGGHVGPDGVYQQGNGHGSWFYRAAGTPEKVVEITPAIPAYDEEVKVEVPCEEPEVPVCGEDGHVPVGDECEEEEPPVDKPETPVDNDKCIGRPVIGGKCAPVKNEPKPQVGTSCTATKCVRTNEDGSVVVTDYGNDVVEEGF